jgi:hypothetical protein
MSQHPKVPREHRRRHGDDGAAWRIWTSEPKLLVGSGAFVTAIATVLGLFISNQGEERRAAVEPTTSATVASTTTAVPPSTTDSTGSTAGATEAPTTSSSTRREPAGVFRQTGADAVAVPERFGIDLDTQESNWGISPFAPPDIYVAPGVDSVRGITLAIVRARPAFEDCEAQTVLQRYLTRAQTVVGQQMCVKSSDGRWAHVRIAAIDRSAKTMSFKIVVWKLPTDP